MQSLVSTIQSQQPELTTGELKQLDIKQDNFVLSLSTLNHDH